MRWEYGDGVDWSTGCLLCFRGECIQKKRCTKGKWMGEWGWKEKLDESIRPVRYWWVGSRLCPKRSLLSLTMFFLPRSLKWVYHRVVGRSGWIKDTWKNHYEKTLGSENSSRLSMIFQQCGEFRMEEEFYRESQILLHFLPSYQLSHCAR